jgi:hypothetical protein
MPTLQVGEGSLTRRHRCQNTSAARCILTPEPTWMDARHRSTFRQQMLQVELCNGYLRGPEIMHMRVIGRDDTLVRDVRGTRPHHKSAT